MISDVISNGPHGGRASVAHSNGATSTVFDDNAAVNETQLLSLSQDVKYVTRLFRKIAMAYVDRGTNGIAVLSDRFTRLDRTLHGDNFIADIWAFKAFFRSGECSLSDKELSVLFILMDDESTGEVDLAEVLVKVRKQLHCTMQQFHDILKRARAKRLDRDSCPWTSHNLALRRNATSSSKRKKERPVRAIAFDYLVDKAGLTQSEAFLVLEKCSAPAEEVEQPHGDSPLGQSSGPMELDVEYLESVLFDFPMPHDVAYPILIGKFIDTLSDPTTDYNGTVGLLRAAVEARFVVDERMARDKGDFADITASDSDDDAEEHNGQQRLQPKRRLDGSPSSQFGGRPPLIGRNSSDGKQKKQYWGETSIDDMSPTKTKRQEAKIAAIRHLSANAKYVFIDREAFRHLIAIVGGGLPAGEADVLFSYLEEPNSGQLSLHQLILDVQRRLPVESPERIQMIINSMRSQIIGHSTSSNYFGLNELHLALAAYGEEQAPVDLGTSALRKCGVSASVTADIEIEQVLSQAPTCVQLVLLLRGVLPKSRYSLLKQLFEKLDENQDGLIDRNMLLTEFVPHNVDVKVGISTKALEKEIQYFIASLPSGDEQMSFEEFTYFWGNVSASIPDDSTFTLLLWRAYDMCHDNNPVTPSRRGRPGSSRASAASGMSHQRHRGDYNDGMSIADSSATTPQRRRFRRFLGE